MRAATSEGLTMTIDQLAMQQLHDDMTALTKALVEFKDVIDAAMPVTVTNADEIAGLIAETLAQIPLTVRADEAEPVKVEVVEDASE